MTSRSRGRIHATVTYLEMREPPPARGPAPPPGSRARLELLRLPAPALAFYRFLFDAVGRDCTWTSRALLDDAQLAAVLRDPAVEVRVLFADGLVAGFTELDRRAPPGVEIAFFGLLPSFRARGLGSWLLDVTVREAWRNAPRRVWLHTCDLDHPAALRMYRRAGFVEYDRRREATELF